jgi:phosphatidylglycerophosphate synthase
VKRGAALRLENRLAERPPAGASLPEIAEHAVRTGVAKEFAARDFTAYIPMLRRDLPAYLLRITDSASRDRAERFLFRSNYKGSTDFLTRYVYPPVVWALLRPLTRWRVHPNWITGCDWILAFAVIPLFAGGVWLPGLFLAYAMSILDSVDGKLARLTFRHSGFGEFADHGLDVLHPPLWYMAWAWWLGGGEVASAPFQASLWLLGFYTLDRVSTGVFRQRTGTSIHGFTPLDEKVRTFISRRNVNLAFFTIALAADWAAPGHDFALAAFYFIVAWQAACLVWHVERLIRFWDDRSTA